MTKTQNTPWSAGPHPWPEQVGCCPLVGRPYSVHGTDNRNVAAAVSEDIARLISAAPDLLAALEGLMTHEPDYSDTLWQNAKDAIAKAEGRT